MTIPVAINGFGRIGRLVLRAIHENGREEFQVKAINDLGSAEMNAHLFKHDTVHGKFHGSVRAADDALIVEDCPIRVFRESDPESLPWRELGVEIVLECSGKFRKREQAVRHIDAGARRVLISAPADGADITIVYGVNHEKLTPHHKIVSNASCTTNCMAPVAAVLDKAIGIESGSIVTVHGYTGDQNLVDGLHRDPHRARAAAASLVPTTTGAARAIGLVLPELAGLIDGMALRVPIPNVSVAYFTFRALRDTSVDEIHAAMRAAAAGSLKGVLDYSDEPLVSADYNHNPFSAVYDASGTIVVGKRLCTVMAWYDNEWAFALRMLDTASAMAACREP